MKSLDNNLEIIYLKKKKESIPLCAALFEKCRYPENLTDACNFL